MNDFLNEAREAIDKAVEKAAPVVEDVKDKVETAVADLKEKAAPVIEDIREKAAPVVEKVKDGVTGAVEAVKDGAEKIGDLFVPDAPGMNVKNELFDQLGEQVQAQKAASMSKAEEMQKKLEELMGKK
ncbi:MAG: hypothetical protein IJ466_04640 [Clostridia bacterium]|nr:hypothetical protein [Clostridia bacterium]